MQLTLTHRRLRQQIARLQPSDHVCGFYRTKAEQVAIVSAFVAERIRRRDRCLVIADESTLRRVAATDESDADRHHGADAGAIALQTPEQSYLKGNDFKPSAMIGDLRKACVQAQSDGYVGLSAVGEMAWSLQDLPGVDRLIEYEQMAEDFIRARRLIGLCLYDINRFPAASVHGVLRTHRLLLFNGLLRASPFFGSHVRSVEWMLQQCRRHPRASRSKRPLERDNRTPR